MRRRRSALVGVLLLAGLTACTAPTQQPTTSPNTVSTPAPSEVPSVASARAPSSSSSSSSSSVSAPAAPSDPNRPSGQCSDAAITVSLSMPKGAAGTFDQDLVFTNTGGSACELRGAPGLSVVGDGNGTQLGVPAARDQSGARTVRLAAHGGQVYAPFSGPELASGGGGAARCPGGVRSGDGYRVFAPHSTRAFFVRDGDAAACVTGGAFLRVAVVRALGTP
jgi:hypothetical protein